MTLALEGRILAIGAAGVALAAGLGMLGLERRGRSGLGPAGVLVGLAAGLALAPTGGAGWAPLVLALVVAALSRDGDDVLHGECALKLLWVMGSALALSWAGLELLTLSTGTPYVLEQWSVLGIGLDPVFLWNTALPLSLLVGVVLLGVAPFHFWLADMFQGVRPWLAPLAATALQASGASWLAARLHGVSAFAPGARLAGELLRMASLIAFVAAAATLVAQRRPERRVGTLASLQGTLVLALIAGGRPPDPDWMIGWAAHLALALTGASTLARFLPVRSTTGTPAPLLRRHRVVGAAGLLALFSLAGLPGTPGGSLWLDVASALGAAGHTELVFVLGLAWMAALWRAFEQLREAFGVPAPAGEPIAAVPLPARAAMGIAGAALASLMIARLVR